MKLLRPAALALVLAATSVACTRSLPTEPTTPAAPAAPSHTTGTGMMGGGTR